jgi:hypothetical protein
VNNHKMTSTLQLTLSPSSLQPMRTPPAFELLSRSHDTRHHVLQSCGAVPTKFSVSAKNRERDSPAITW